MQKFKFFLSIVHDLQTFLCHTYRLERVGQYRIILSADTASEVRQMLSQKRR